MNTEINTTQFIEKVLELYDSRYDGDNLPTFLDELWDEVSELYNVYDGQFTESEEHQMLREINKRVGTDMKWWDYFNPSPEKKEETEQKRLTRQEKFRLEQDQIMDRYKGGDFE